MSHISSIAGIAGDIATVAAAVISAIALFVALYAGYRSELPQVVASLEFDGDRNCIYLVVQNLGKGVAYDILLSGYDDAVWMERFRPQVSKSFVTKGIPILVPGAKRSTVVAAGRIMDEMKDVSSPLLITYSERGFLCSRKTVVEEFTLDYESYSGSIYMQSDSHLLRTAMERIEKHLKKSM